MTTLPGPMLDLLTEGADLDNGGRSAVVGAVRKVMLSAHRHGITYSDVFALLTDTTHRRLARQLAHGRGGRPIAAVKRNALLREQWQACAAVVARGPAWDSDDVEAAVDLVRDAIDDAVDLDARDRAVLNVVVDLAAAYRTTRPAVPVWRVVEATGLTRNTAHRVLMRLCEAGVWLSLAQRGNRHTGRANLYRLAPPLLATYGGLRPPTSQAPPTSHPPTSHPEGSDMAAITLTIRAGALDDPVLQEALTRLAAAGAVPATEPMPANVVPIRSTR